jgi:uncharacterized pyridoxamine 5'-phosphate oxidase family protein
MHSVRKTTSNEESVKRLFVDADKYLVDEDWRNLFSQMKQNPDISQISILSDRDGQCNATAVQ